MREIIRDKLSESELLVLEEIKKRDKIGTQTYHLLTLLPQFTPGQIKGYAAMLQQFGAVHCVKQIPGYSRRLCVMFSTAEAADIFMARGNFSSVVAQGGKSIFDDDAMADEDWTVGTWGIKGGYKFGIKAEF